MCVCAMCALMEMQSLDRLEVAAAQQCIYVPSVSPPFSSSMLPLSLLWVHESGLDPFHLKVQLLKSQIRMPFPVMHTAE